MGVTILIVESHLCHLIEPIMYEWLNTWFVEVSCSFRVGVMPTCAGDGSPRRIEFWVRGREDWAEPIRAIVDTGPNALPSTERQYML